MAADLLTWGMAMDQREAKAKTAELNTLTDGEYEMLRAAVEAARQFQCRSVKALKDRLLMIYPCRGSEINQAIHFWASSVRQRYPNGVSK